MAAKGNGVKKRMGGMNKGKKEVVGGRRADNMQRWGKRFKGGGVPKGVGPLAESPKGLANPEKKEEKERRKKTSEGESLGQKGSELRASTKTDGEGVRGWCYEKPKPTIE